jgi:hypothetical protein
MESTFQRLIAVSIALLLMGSIIALNDHGKSKGGASPTPAPTTTQKLGTIAPAGCLPLPGKTKYPSWYPKDLPLPEGSYPADVKLPAARGYPRAIFAVRATLKDFIIFVLGEWRKTGWTLGRGEAEAGEAEDNFFKAGTDVRGAFVARTDYCDAGWVSVYIVMGSSRAPRPTPSPTGSGTAINP